MKYRVLGNTGLQVSALGYGASALGSMYGDIDEATGVQVVHTALNCGVNFVDVAPFYGLTKAEVVLGKALAAWPRDTYILATKTGRIGWDDFDFSQDAIIRSAEASMRRLGVDYLDILQLHDIEYHGGRYMEQALSEGIAALQRLKSQGKIRFFGITAYPIAVLKDALARVDVDTALCHNHYSLADNQLLDLIPLTAAKQVGLIAAAPLGTSLLTEKGAAQWHPASEFDRNVVGQAARYCRDHGTTIEKLAIQFATANDQIATMLVSAAESEIVRRNIAWMDEQVDWGLIEAVLAILAPIRNRDWNFGG